MSDEIILIENGEIILNDSTSHIRTNQQSQITLSDEYIRKLKLDKDDLVIQKNHNGTIKIITSNVNDTILYLQQLHINLDDIEIQKVSIVDSYFNNKKQRGSNYDTKLLENRI